MASTSANYQSRSCTVPAPPRPCRSTTRKNEIMQKLDQISRGALPELCLCSSQQPSRTAPRSKKSLQRPGCDGLVRCPRSCQRVKVSRCAWSKASASRRQSTPWRARRAEADSSPRFGGSADNTPRVFQKARHLLQRCELDCRNVVSISAVLPSGQCTQN